MKFFVVICTGYEIYLAQKIEVKNFFFPFVDTSVAGKLHFRYKMHAETYTQVVVVTKILYVCSNHSILASDSFHANKLQFHFCFTVLSFKNRSVFETRTNKTYIHAFLKPKVRCKLQKIANVAIKLCAGQRVH